MKIPVFWRNPYQPKQPEPIPKAYKPWIILSMVFLLGGLLLVAIAVVAAFVTFAAQGTPLWVVVLGVFAVLGTGLGFGGLFLLLGIAGWTSYRESRRVQVLPPEPAEADGMPERDA